MYITQQSIQVQLNKICKEASAAIRKGKKTEYQNKQIVIRGGAPDGRDITLSVPLIRVGYEEDELVYLCESEKYQELMVHFCEKAARSNPGGGTMLCAGMSALLITTWLDGRSQVLRLEISSATYEPEVAKK